jgi:hypothetical protein
MVKIRDRVGRPWWARVAGAMGSSTVVMANVFGEHDTQVPLIEDQHAVGEFGSKGANEPLGETVHPRTPRRNPDHLDAHIGQDGINDAANWPTRSGSSPSTV